MRYIGILFLKILIILEKNPRMAMVKMSYRRLVHLKNYKLIEIMPKNLLREKTNLINL